MNTAPARMIATVALTSTLFGCDFTSGLKLHNLTSRTLTPYPVVTTPPPPHREADPAGAVAPGATASIDPAGFNPVFYASGVTEIDKANGLFLGLALQNADPLTIQYRVFHYKVPPGQESIDPAQQPILLHEGIREVADADQKITVTEPTDIGTPAPPGGWIVEIAPQ